MKNAYYFTLKALFVLKTFIFLLWLFGHVEKQHDQNDKVNPSNVNPRKWPNTLKQFAGKLPTNCLSVFDHFVKLALKRLISKLMISQLTKQIICILRKISRTKGNQTMKFGQLIEFNMRNIFLEKSYIKCGGEMIPRPFSKKSKLSISRDQQSNLKVCFQ